MRKFFVFIITFLLCSCADASLNQPPKSIEKEFSFKEHFIEFNGDKKDSAKYYPSNGYINSGGIFLSKWKKDNVSINDGCLEMSLTDKEDVNYGSEIRTYQGFLYGYFGTRLKTFKKEGTVQSFFTYPQVGEPHDEIDIEFLGIDTTKVQFNYFDNDIGGHEYSYDLGFDSSLDFHDYGFIWEETYITWFVDFKPVYQVEASLDQWGFVYQNVWAGNPENSTALNWLGKYEKSSTKYSAYYDYIIASEFCND